MYEHLPGKKEKSVHLLDWPEIRSDYLNKELEKRWEQLITLRSRVTKKLEEARNKKIIGNSLEARVILTPDTSWQKVMASTTLQAAAFDLSQLFIVSQVEIKPADKNEEITIEKAHGQKCPRCWIWNTSVTADQDICNKCKKAIT